MKQLLFLFFVFLTALGNSQIFDPVSWDYSATKNSEQEFTIILKADLDEGWALYSQFVDEGGPIPTEFTFQENSSYNLMGSVEESDTNKSTGHDAIFDMVVSKFKKEAVFSQKVKLNGTEVSIKGSVYYQVCNDERCLMPTEKEFEFVLKNGELTLADLNNSQKKNVDGEQVNKTLYGFLPSDITSSEYTCSDENVSSAQDIKQSKSLWSIFVLGFFGGLLALLTPCVFPMIPLTVSFFTKKGDSSSSKGGFGKAFLYGFFILLVYLVLSVPFHLLDSVNPDILNEISTNVVLNIIFFLIFIFFAFSFFGYYELTLPASWTSKTTQGENIGGVVGIFFMALTLAIVSFSCTGPILGSLLAGSLTADGGAWQLTAGMAGFGVALGLPFALFAAFPSWLNSIPKSGGWLNTTKVVLGFLELALAFKFLSTADLVKQWGILKIEVFLGIWIIVFIGLALYLFGKIKFPHDGPLQKLSFLRISTGILAIAFAIYMATGFQLNKETNTFKSLTVLSGVAPPVGYSWLYPNDCPNNLNCFKDLKEGLLYAQKVNKPVMIDFTGYGCANCRRMEEQIWPERAVDDLIRNDYVLISLYVDDKKELPKEEQVEVNKIDGGTRILKNYGHKWAYFQTEYFQANSQPYYVLLSSDGKTILNNPVGYTPNENEYVSFLKCGIEALNSTTKPTTNFTIQ
ncbi:MAG: protein-disulfide reductase DsbD family protein [bacterium]